MDSLTRVLRLVARFREYAQRLEDDNDALVRGKVRKGRAKERPKGGGEARALGLHTHRGIIISAGRPTVSRRPNGIEMGANHDDAVAGAGAGQGGDDAGLVVAGVLEAADLDLDLGACYYLLHQLVHVRGARRPVRAAVVPVKEVGEPARPRL